MFESQLKNITYKKSLNIMNHIHNNKANNISKWNLLHDILNTSKHTKNINRHYYLILHVCMNTRKGKETIKNVRLLLDSECSSKILMRNLIIKINP